jgi:Fe-S oxidoreductase
VGELGLFEEQKEGCEELFEKYDITELVTSSPHCFHTFKNEYPEAAFRARHYTLLLKRAHQRWKASVQKGIEAKVTYHDPCYLGRHNRIFDEPREIIRAIPGLTLVEMPTTGRTASAAAAAGAECGRICRGM